MDQENDEPPELQLRKLSLGSKMILLMDILKEAETVGDKVLVFSQSLLSLDLIQEFLRTIDESNNKGGYGAGDMENYWDLGKKGEITTAWMAQLHRMSEKNGVIISTRFQIIE